MRFLTDFNEIENEDRIWADLDDAEFFFERDLQIGRPVELTDGAGHWCVGIVIGLDLDRRLIRLKIDWQTWRSERHPRNKEYFSGYNAQFAGNLENRV